ncbi:MAG: hypothetical protein ACF8PN_02655 [Phycisphaerales bacterium]
MSSSYIPTQDAQALAWMQAFSAGISANPALYMLSAADATAIANAVADFDTAYTTASAPGSRTPVTIAEKDDARTSAEQICRQFATLIKYNAGISDPDKIAIGVRPVNPNREPIDAPQTSPLLNIIGCTPGAQTVRYADTNTPDSGAKPFGAMQIQLFVAVDENAVADPDLAKFHGAFTRNPIGVGFDADDDGKMATYFGRWVSRKGDVGPWSLPISMRIAA